jgi:hypothetical protein
MKPLIITFSLALIAFSSFSQGNATLINEKFAELSGEWEGNLVYLDVNDNKTEVQIPAKCTCSYDGKAWLYEVLYADVEEGGAGECFVSSDGTKMTRNGVKWDITSVEEKGDKTIIVMETKGKDNGKKGMLKQSIVISPTTFELIEEVKYQESDNFFQRSKHTFKRKKV